jgi:hypothetical protein
MNPMVNQTLIKAHYAALLAGGLPGPPRRLRQGRPARVAGGAPADSWRIFSAFAGLRRAAAR